MNLSISNCPVRPAFTALRVPLGEKHQADSSNAKDACAYINSIWDPKTVSCPQFRAFEFPNKKEEDCAMIVLAGEGVNFQYADTSKMSAVQRQLWMENGNIPTSRAERKYLDIHPDFPKSCEQTIKM